MTVLNVIITVIYIYLANRNIYGIIVKKIEIFYKHLF